AMSSVETIMSRSDGTKRSVSVPLIFSTSSKKTYFVLYLPGAENERIGAWFSSTFSGSGVECNQK
ncbi:MAG: hypothetical protein Q7K33_03870, partial [Candidatus Berkelbacteria bacterium]|nr:hypothetical protein [Candidatus Berkelbacteria bacterium]